VYSQSKYDRDLQACLAHEIQQRNRRHNAPVSAPHPKSIARTNDPPSSMARTPARSSGVKEGARHGFGRRVTPRMRSCTPFSVAAATGLVDFFMSPKESSCLVPPRTACRYPVGTPPSRRGDARRLLGARRSGNPGLARLRGTEGSNPASSSGESSANLTSSNRALGRSSPRNDRFANQTYARRTTRPSPPSARMRRARNRSRPTSSTGSCGSPALTIGCEIRSYISVL